MKQMYKTYQIERWERSKTPGALILFFRMLLIALAAIAAARIIFWGIDYYLSRGGGGPGAEIFLPFYMVLLFVAGWNIRNWTIEARNRKERYRYVLRDQRNIRA